MRWAVTILFLAQTLGSAGCTQSARRPTAAYLLIDAARWRSAPAEAVVNYLLSALQPGESFGIACVGTGNFSDSDTIASICLDARPSLATQQKHFLKKKFDEFSPLARPAPHLDIAGALLYAVAQLGETKAEERYVLILADLGKEQIPEPVKDFPLQMEGCRVIALILESGELAARPQAVALERLEAWGDWVEKGGGQWRVVRNLTLLERIFAES